MCLLLRFNVDEDARETKERPAVLIEKAVALEERVAARARTAVRGIFMVLCLCECEPVGGSYRTNV